MLRRRPDRTVQRTFAAGVATFVLAASSSCATPVHSRQPSTPAPTATQIATTVDARIAQSRGVSALLGPHPVERADGGAMFAAPAGTSIPDAIAADGPLAVNGVRGLDSHASKNPLLVLVAATDAQYRHFTGSAPGDQLATTKTDTSMGLPYVVLAPRTVHDPNDALARETMVHEAFHALTLEHLQVKRPRWLIEGWAEYVGQKTVPQAPHKRTDIQPHLPSDAELLGPDGPDAYYVAFTFARYLRDTYGNDRTMAFYTDAVTSRTSMDQLARTSFGKTIAQLQAGYQAWYPTFH